MPAVVKRGNVVTLPFRGPAEARSTVLGPAEIVAGLSRGDEQALAAAWDQHANRRS